MFDWNGKYIKLNWYGKVFYVKVEFVLKILEYVKYELKDMLNDFCEEICFVVLVSLYLFSELLSRFCE